MANNRYLEVIKRLLSAETYIRWRQQGHAHETKPPAEEDKPR